MLLRGGVDLLHEAVKLLHAGVDLLHEAEATTCWC